MTTRSLYYGAYLHVQGVHLAQPTPPFPPGLVYIGERAEIDAMHLLAKCRQSKRKKEGLMQKSGGNVPIQIFLGF